jgi:hypothetical protein
MHRIDGPGATVDNKFTEGDPVGSIPATVVTDDWLNAIQEELMSILAAAGVAPVKAKQDQLLESLGVLIRAQALTAYTTAGTSPAFTLTPSPAISAYATNQRFRVRFNAGAANGTLNVSGKGAKNLKQYDSTGSKIAAVIVADMISDVEYDGTDMIVRDPLPVSGKQIQPITATVASSALTVGINPTSLDFRSSTLSSGVVNTRPIASALSLVVPSGATLGSVNGQYTRLAVLAIDNAGTVEPAIANLAGGVNLDETALINTTAISSGSTSANVVYSASARTAVPFRVVGIADLTQATAGAWVTPPSLVQGAGGQAVAAMSSIGYGQTPLDVSSSRAFNTNYPNITGKPKLVSIQAAITGAVSTAHLIINVNGVPFRGSDAANGARSFVTAIIPPGMVGNANLNTGSSSQTFWTELG